MPAIFSSIGWCSRTLRHDELLALWDCSSKLIRYLNLKEGRKICSWNSIPSKLLVNLLTFLLFDNPLLCNDYLNVISLPGDAGGLGVVERKEKGVEADIKATFGNDTEAWFIF